MFKTTFHIFFQEPQFLLAAPYLILQQDKLHASTHSTITLDFCNTTHKTVTMEVKLWVLLY